jgi:hypothetical protein
MEREKIIYFLSFFCRHTPFHKIWRQFYFIFILAEIMHNKTVIRGALETLVRKKKSRRQETFRQKLEKGENRIRRFLPHFGPSSCVVGGDIWF